MLSKGKYDTIKVNLILNQKRTMWIENKKETPEEMKKQENINYLKKFWEGNDDNDQKLMSDPEGGKMMKGAVLENVNKKLAWVNDPKTKEAIANLENQLNEMPDGPLNKEDAQKLKETYNKLNNLEAQEFVQDGEQAKDVQQKRDVWKKEYADKLDEATETLREMLKENARVAQENVKKSQEAAQQANKEWERAQKQAWVEADWLLESLESPQATA